MILSVEKTTLVRVLVRSMNFFVEFSFCAFTCVMMLVFAHITKAQAQSPTPSAIATNAIATSTTATSTIKSALLKQLQRGDTEYRVRLTSGDILSGKVLEVLEQSAGTSISASMPEEGIVLETSLGKLTIFLSEISEIIPRRSAYRHNHRAYIMPTAEPIGNNHFIGLWELIFAYAGAGIGDVVSLTGGRTLVPFLSGDEQATLVNVKITPYVFELDESGNRLFTCVGGNFALANTANQFWHAYVGATFKGARSSITGHVFYKVNEPSTYRIRAGNFLDFTARYPASTLGIGAALDTRIGDRHDMHFIGELWNANVLQPSATAILLGLRLSNTAVSMDAGLAIFTQPFVFPFVSFAWTPF